MKNIILRIALAGALVALPLTASAAMTDAEAKATVESMLADGRSSVDIIGTLMDDGRDLESATVISVGAATGDAKLSLAREGICLSQNTAEAEKVGKACAGVCTADTVTMIEGLVAGYATGGCDPTPEPPVVHDTGYSPGTASGGGVSPAT